MTDRREALDAWLDRSGELVDEMVQQFRDRQAAETRWENVRKSKKALDKQGEV